MRSLRYGAIVLAYNQEEYIAYCLEALAPHVDHIAVVYSDIPWTAYNASARDLFGVPDRTREILAGLAPQISHMSVVSGEWATEEAMRNAGLDELRRVGPCDVCLSVDADEFFPGGGLERLKREIARRNLPGSRYYVPYKGCYKRFDRLLQMRWELEPGRVEHVMRAAFATHLEPETRFYRTRHTTGTAINLPTSFYFWHMGYVLSDERMWEKVNSWAHAFEVPPGWFEEKWLAWTPDTRDLFFRQPASAWPGTVPIDAWSLPDVLHTHPYFPKTPLVELSICAEHAVPWPA